jgi:hypothetical protein
MSTERIKWFIYLYIYWDENKVMICDHGWLIFLGHRLGGGPELAHLPFCRHEYLLWWNSLRYFFIYKSVIF